MCDDPRRVVTGSEICLFPGAGKPVTAIDYRLTQRGFYEMTGVSHLGLAIPYLARLRELGFAGWESAARDLLVQCRVVRKNNSTSFWRDTVAVEAWAGLEEKIADRRTEERRVGKECVSTFRFRWSPSH